MQKEYIKSVDINELIPYDKNYQEHSQNLDYIKNSLRDFGYVKISVICDENSILLTGHGTIEAMKELGWTQVPEIIKITGLTEKQKSAYRIADNTSSKKAGIIYENLEYEIEKIGDEYDMTGYGLDYGGTEENPNEYILLKFNTQQEYTDFKNKVGMTLTKRTLKYADFLDKWNAGEGEKDEQETR